ncbi:MAG: lipopolysaccharide biosynthesis protein [Clostridia bacterium]|nr:lipopolysaccharide biosynthesis protein [Clostridia bacterium]
MKLDVDVNRGVVVKSFAWKAAERFISQGINLVVQIFLARLLLPEAHGSVQLIVVITNYASIFVNTGLAQAIVQKEDIDELDVSTLLTASLAIAAVAYAILYAMAPFGAVYFNMPELKWTLRVQAIILFFYAIYSVQTALLSRRMKFKKIFFRTLLAVGISGTIAIFMAIKGFGVWAIIAQNLVNMLVIVIYMSFDKDLRVPLGFSLERAKKLYSFTSKIMMTSLVAGFNDTFRTTRIGKKYTRNDLAFYSKAYTYSGYVTQVVHTSMQSVLLSTFSRSQTEIERLRQMARRSVRLSAFIMFPVLIGFAVMANNVVPVLLTPKWNPCIPFLILFMLLRIPGVTMSVDKQVYYALGRSEINLYYEIGLLIFNLISISITVMIGTLAIAVGATLAEYLGAIAIFIISSKVYGYSLFERIRDLIKPIISSAVMAGAALSTELLKLGNMPTLLLKAAVCAAVYLLIALITKDETFKYLITVLTERFRGKKGDVAK